MNVIALLFLCCIASVSHAAGSVFIEELTWPEIRDAIVAGKTTAIVYAGSTEQNGPHMVIGKHNLVARYVANGMARKLGDALVYPILPFAPTGDPEQKTGHMRFPGSVSVSESTYAAVIRDIALSARAAGFTTVALMGDHGGGQEVLRQLAEDLNHQWSSHGVRVLYIGDLYYRAADLAEQDLAKEGLRDGIHAGIIDTSELLFVDRRRSAVRSKRMAKGNEANGVDGDPRLASPQKGSRFIAFKIDSAVAQIRQLTKAR